MPNVRCNHANGASMFFSTRVISLARNQCVGSLIGATNRAATMWGPPDKDFLKISKYILHLILYANFWRDKLVIYL
jgi:hypothetical protein